LVDGLKQLVFVVSDFADEGGYREKREPEGNNPRHNQAEEYQSVHEKKEITALNESQDFSQLFAN